MKKIYAKNISENKYSIKNTNSLKNKNILSINGSLIYWLETKECLIRYENH